MKINWGRAALIGIALLALTAAAGFLAPMIGADRARRPLAAALEQTLGRPVEFGKVQYQLFPRPGLSAMDLVIPDDPAFGREPLAYVGEMQAGVSFTSLLTGRLSFSSVRLVDASVNLARKDEAGWNFAALLQKVFSGVRDGKPGPRVEMRQSRINFRTGTLKSALFLNAVDLDLEPPTGSGGDLRWKYEASPARTDRAEQGFGRFTGSGRWTPSQTGESRLAVDLELERSAIAELLTLVTGVDLGVQGRFSSRATLDGPLQQLKIRGSVELEEVNRAGLFSFRSKEFSLPYEGTLDLAGQTLEITSRKPEGNKAALPFGVTLLCRRLLSDPQWEAGLKLESIPAPVLLDFARRLGARTPRGLAVQGEITGALNYAQSQPAQGAFTLSKARVAIDDSQPLAVESAQIDLAGSQLSLEPAEFATPEGASATVGGRWDLQSEALEFELKTARLPLNDLRATAARLEIEPPVLLAGRCQDGDLEGGLRFERVAQSGETQGPDTWTGELALRRANCAVEGIGKPVALETAAVSLRKTGWLMRGIKAAYGSWTVAGEVSHLAGRRRGVQFKLSIPAADGTELEELLKAGLMPRRGFLDRTLRRQAASPAWLRGRHAEGEVRIGRLSLGDESFDGVHARVYWDGAHVEAPDVTARWKEGQFSGRASVLLGAEKPLYRLQGRVEGYASAIGQFDAEIDVSAPTLAAPLAGVLAGTAQISGRQVELGEEKARLLNACVNYDGARGAGALRFTCLEAQFGGEWVTGQAAGGAEGRLLLEFASPRHPARVALSTSPFQLLPAAR